MSIRTVAHTRNISKWHVRFLELARHVSTWSKDPSTKVGAVIVDEHRRVVSIGYNGFAQGVADTEERLNDRSLKYPLVIHGERNAMLFANRDLTGCTLYTYPFMPCASCASMAIQLGIEGVVSTDIIPPRWVTECTLAQQVFQESGVWLMLVKDLLNGEFLDIQSSQDVVEKGPSEQSVKRETPAFDIEEPNRTERK